jgi:hypothetical protein
MSSPATSTKTTSIERMKEFTDEKGIPFWEISKDGETINLINYPKCGYKNTIN